MASTVGFTLGIVALAVLWFAFLWVGICFLFAKASGWTRLRQLYESAPLDGPTSTVSGRLGRSRLRGALIVAGTSAGLYLNVTAPFRIFVRPVLIPWHDITISPPSNDSLVTLHFFNARTSLRVREDVATNLLMWQQSKPGLHG